MTYSIRSLTSAQLKRAAEITAQIEKLEAELGKIVGGGSVSSAPAAGKRNMSAAGRARIIAAQKARWAKFHASKGKKSK